MAKAPGIHRSDGRPARQFGEDNTDAGEVFSGDTLDAIRAIVEQDDVVPERARRRVGFGRSRSGSEDMQTDLEAGAGPDRPIFRASPEDLAQDQRNSRRTSSPVLSRQGGLAPSGSAAAMVLGNDRPNLPDWRRPVITEGPIGRAFRAATAKPRLLALALLAVVTYWNPLFIPLLLVGLWTGGALLCLAFGGDPVFGPWRWLFFRHRERNPSGALRLIRRGNRSLRWAEGAAQQLPPALSQAGPLPDLTQQQDWQSQHEILRERLERIAASRGKKRLR